MDDRGSEDEGSDEEEEEGSEEGSEEEGSEEEEEKKQGTRDVSPCASKRSTASDDEEEKQGTREVSPCASKRSAVSDEEEPSCFQEGTQKKLKSKDKDAKQGTWEVSPCASKRSAASDDEEQKSNTASCFREGTQKKLKSKDKDEHTLSWIPTALANINSINVHMLCRDAFIALPSPKTCLPDLEKVRNEAMVLVNNTDAAISFTKTRQILLERRSMAGKILQLRRELARSVQYSRAEHSKQAVLLEKAKTELLKQKSLFQKEKETLKCSHKLEVAQYTHEQRDLKRQLEEERDKSICCVCHEKPRDTIILPCLHFQYCFSCVLRHREANSNTCPTCRAPIQGLSMSSYLATQ